MYGPDHPPHWVESRVTKITPRQRALMLSVSVAAALRSSPRVAPAPRAGTHALGDDPAGLEHEDHDHGEEDPQPQPDGGAQEQDLLLPDRLDLRPDHDVVAV